MDASSFLCFGVLVSGSDYDVCLLLFLFYDFMRFTYQYVEIEILYFGDVL